MNRKLRVLIISVIVIQSLFGVAAPAWAAMRPSSQSTRDISHLVEPIPTISLMDMRNINGGLPQYQGYSSAKQVVSPEISSAIRERHSSSSSLSSAIIASGTTRVVTKAADSGPGTFRQALLDAQAGDTILFDTTVFPPTAPKAITLLSPLPGITQDGLSIDGSQAGVVVTMDEYSALLRGYDGLVISGAQYVTIKGLRIEGFFGSAISLLGASHNTISGNTIQANSIGILITDGASHNIIGGTTPGSRNSIMINGNICLFQDCISIQIQDSGTTDNQVMGNYIGVDIGDMTTIGNDAGIVIIGATNNIIGGTSSESRNVINGNTHGIFIQNGDDSIATGNQVLGNYIGLNSSGTFSIGNQAGVVIALGATNNIIGGTVPGARNVISGNGQGVHIQNSDTSNNRVVGNYIGTDVSGSTALDNYTDTDVNCGKDSNNIRVGVALVGTSNNIIGGPTSEERNVIGGNCVGIALAAGINGNPASTDNQVVGNYIGVDVTGTYILRNALVGVIISTGATHNTIGGKIPGTRNVISGNKNTGIQISESATNNYVIGNYIGTDATGQYSLGNGGGESVIGGEIVIGSGIVIGNGAHHNQIGGTTASERNIISGNNGIGLQIQGADTNNNQVMGNYIGTDVDGLHGIGNTITGIGIRDGGQNNVIGGSTPGACNVISGNDQGVHISGQNSKNNWVIGNLVGIDASGLRALGNKEAGIVIANNAQSNRIGGTTEQERNIISGNGMVGVQIQESTNENQVSGNYIGTDIYGNGAIGNGEGIEIAIGPQKNRIGGDAIGAINLISGNTGAGIVLRGVDTKDNQIANNYIGTNISGTDRIPNGNGIEILDAQNNLIGCSAAPGPCNLISGNKNHGVWIDGSNAKANHITGNYIGVNASGTSRLSNGGSGIVVTNNADANVIGGDTPGSGNLISGNTQMGISIQSARNQVLGNLIGVDVSGLNALGNAQSGITITGNAAYNTIGGTDTQQRNIISGNGADGIHIDGNGAIYNQALGNFIGVDINGVLSLGNGSNGVEISNGASHNTVGIDNTITGNITAGVLVSGTYTAQNTISRNSIHHNGGLPIWLMDQPVPIAAPEVNARVCMASISGRSCPGCRVEIFGNPDKVLAGTQFLASANADASGNFSAALVCSPENPYLSFTMTTPDDTTSEYFSGRIRLATYLPLALRP